MTNKEMQEYLEKAAKKRASRKFIREYANRDGKLEELERKARKENREARKNSKYVW